jgi:YD repeat-containing protein
MNYGGGLVIDYDYLVTGEVTRIRENGATSGAGVLASYAYDDLGRRTSLTRGNGTAKSFGYDAASRLSSISEDLAGTAGDLALAFTYNPASQIASSTRSNDVYARTAHYDFKGLRQSKHTPECLVKTTSEMPTGISIGLSL